MKTYTEKDFSTYPLKTLSEEYLSRILSLGHEGQLILNFYADNIEIQKILNSEHLPDEYLYSMWHECVNNLKILLRLYNMEDTIKKSQGEIISMDQLYLYVQEGKEKALRRKDR